MCVCMGCRRCGCGGLVGCGRCGCVEGVVGCENYVGSVGVHIRGNVRCMWGHEGTGCGGNV